MSKSEPKKDEKKDDKKEDDNVIDKIAQAAKLKKVLEFKTKLNKSKTEFEQKKRNEIKKIKE